jgi:glycosyltransferase involved in cell wall biosynthesis
VSIILITIPWFHPAYKAGGPIQSIANMVEQFSENISYKIVCSNTDLDGTVLPVVTDKWITYNKNTEVWYTSKKKGTIRILQEEIKTINPDVLFINDIYSWHFSLIPLLFYKASRKIVSARGMLHPGALSQKYFKKKVYFALRKMLGMNKRCDFHASNLEEKKYIERIFGKTVKVFIAQNFPRIFTLQNSEKKDGTLQLLSIALISPMKNHLLVINALMKCQGYISYNIYGPVKDQAYWGICLQRIKKLPPNIIVNYHGDIPPREVEKALAKNDVFIMPSKSENFGHAIFEALTAGKPVITSNNTPWNNLQLSKAGINIALENTDGLSNAINYFTKMDNDEYLQWSRGADIYADKAINMEDIKEQYRKMFFV